MPKPLQWLSLVALIIAATTTLFLAVTLTPAASQPPSVEAEVFTKQLDFILKTNSAFLGFLGIIGALLTWFFKNNLEDAKQVAAKMVREELDAHIRDLVKTEFRYWELSAQTERVVGQTLVDYYLPNGTTEPQECALLKHRGFRQVLFCNRLEDIRRSAGDVVVLDCQNWQIDANQRLIDLKPDDREAPIRQQLDALLGMLSPQTVLIVYIRGTVKYLYDPKFERRYVLPANNQVTLIGHAVNGAYTASSDRAIQRAN
jgi:hypothetical protein